MSARMRTGSSERAGKPHRLALCEVVSVEALRWRKSDILPSPVPFWLLLALSPLDLRPRELKALIFLNDFIAQDVGVVVGKRESRCEHFGEVGLG